MSGIDNPVTNIESDQLAPDFITGLTEKTVAEAGDFLMIHGQAEDALRKMRRDNFTDGLGGGGGGTRMHVTVPFENLDTYYNKVQINSGTIALDNTNRCLLFSTNGSDSAGAWMSEGIISLHSSVNMFNKGYAIGALAMMSMNPAGSGGTCAGFTGGSDTLFSATGVEVGKHIGFVATCINFTDITYYATHGDGTTQVRTDITSFVQQNRLQYYYAVLNADNIEFYVDGTLVATHSTSLPSGSSSATGSWMIQCRNGAGETANSSLSLRNFNFSFDPTVA